MSALKLHNFPFFFLPVNLLTYKFLCHVYIHIHDYLLNDHLLFYSMIQDLGTPFGIAQNKVMHTIYL